MRLLLHPLRYLPLLKSLRPACKKQRWLLRLRLLLFLQRLLRLPLHWLILRPLRRLWLKIRWLRPLLLAIL